MDFTEQVKKEVKEKAAFRCCRCQQIGIHFHHILPQEFGGSSDIDNAAPLCPSCHDYFGGNPEKRKEIRQMRDWWYERVTMIFPDNRQLNALDAINNKLDKLQQKQIGLDDFKQVLFSYNQEYFNYSSEMIKNMTLGTAAVSASAIVNASFSPSPSPSSSPSEPEDDSPS